MDDGIHFGTCPWQLIQSIVICPNIYQGINTWNIKILRKLPDLKAIYIMVTGVCERDFKLYNPSTRYELSMDSVPPRSRITWKSLLDSYQGLIAKDWGQEPVPLKGLLANHEPSLDCVVPGPNILYLGEYRDWMVLELVV
jgi:hypothetical protein